MVEQQWETFNTKYTAIKPGHHFIRPAVLHYYVQLKLTDN